jgi:hypothetical protein
LLAYQHILRCLLLGVLRIHLGNGLQVSSAIGFGLALLRSS